ncbi:hypothetical protein I302_101241 [Kwoniella bestiolae CBS 10118]|uniref:N-glycosylation protein EOS1 n=1 Tax=Kwoniella bestiolae CBS 10118 TaxID=1296100 RepID=A0A1B9G7D4_9TREE|nr:hypothetical protein I302_04613 [Kwoniella bestiolae CBS 10118]OCF26922.1 hypothetical protein I302_04613 [Kwoniella bestiolae CBS 10118]
MSLTSSPSPKNLLHQLPSPPRSSNGTSTSPVKRHSPSSTPSSSSSYTTSPRSRSYTVNTSTSINGNGNSPRNGYTKSAPVSPNGRISIQGLTPISNIHGLQLDQIHPQGQARYNVPQQQQHNGQGLGIVGPPTAIPIPSPSTSYGKSQTHPQPQVHAYSFPSSHHVHSQSPSSYLQQAQVPQMPWQVQQQQQQQQQQQAGPSRQSQPQPPPSQPSHPSHPSAPGISAGNRPAYNPTTAQFARYKARQIPPTSKTRYNGNGNGEDSGIDSDATVRPMGGGPTRSKGSLSQPDLTALRSKRVEGWTENLRGKQPVPQLPTHSSSVEHNDGGPNANGNGEIKRRPSTHRTKTPPSTTSRPPSSEILAKENWLPASPTHSRSHSSQSLSSLARKSPSTSPRSASSFFPIMSPITPSRPNLYSSSEDEDDRRNIGSTALPISIPLDKGNSSSDADDDYSNNSHSPSSGSGSGSITFSPKRTKFKSSSSGGLRNRFLMDKRGSLGYSPTTSASSTSTGLGLTLNYGDGDGDGDTVGTETDIDVDRKESLNQRSASIDHERKGSKRVLDKLEKIFQNSTLLPLRLLAIVPSLWGICVLSQALITAGLWVDVWPWGVDLTREALERLVAGGEGQVGEWRRVDRGDVGICIAWAICTAHFCFSLTTGLTHRWRSYYSLPSTITRLVSLQCLCWPATYLTLWFLGVERLLLCWVVIGVTTGWSRTVQMWVTSNVVPPPSSANHTSEDGGGDITPNLRKMSIGPPEIPEGLSMWEAFRWGRKWDWDNVANEVGWKVGGLLLVTCAWLFWGIEKGTKVRV